MNDRSLAARFAELSVDLLGESDVDLTFDRVARRATEMVPACAMASVTLRARRGRAETVAATDPAAERLDALQYALGEGPCLDVAAERGNVLVADVTTEDRWPGWSDEARGVGLGAALVIRLHTDTETMGTLTLYSWRPGAFDDEAVDLALIYAAHATEAMSKARLVTGLRTALESRHTIGIAQGVLAARYGVSYERAFDVLHRFSNDNNVKLRDVAEMVARDRGLPDLPDVPTVPDPVELDTA